MLRRVDFSRDLSVRPLRRRAHTRRADGQGPSRRG
jgi:hypothetical protein